MPLLEAAASELLVESAVELSLPPLPWTVTATTATITTRTITARKRAG